MVNPPRRHAISIALALGFTFSLFAKELVEYRPGDRVEQDIITPVALKVLDPDATAVLKENEAMRVPIILRQDLWVANDVESLLHRSFHTTRSNFLRMVQQVFKTNKLDVSNVASPEFEFVRSAFGMSHTGFPVSTKLAAAWAQGDPGQAELTTVGSRLRESLRQPIRDSDASTRIRMTATARLVTVADRNETLTLESLGDRGSLIPSTNAVPLDRAKRELEDQFAPEDIWIGRFASSLLRANCQIEESLTERLRAERTETVLVTTEYQPGEAIARAGQVVDARVFAAIQALTESATRTRLQHTADQAVAGYRRARKQVKWLSEAACALVIALSVVTWQWLRRRREATLLPMRMAAESVGATGLTPDAAAWQQRAQEAERRAQRAQEAMRAGVSTQVSKVLKEKLVQELVTQRTELLEAQQAAAAEMVALEQRLNEVQAPLQERLRQYESRIAELEQALATKTQENRELIKAKISLVRQQLEVERSHNPAVLN